MQAVSLPLPVRLDIAPPGPQLDQAIEVSAPGWPTLPPASPLPPSLNRSAWTDWKDIAAGRYGWEGSR